MIIPETVFYLLFILIPLLAVINAVLVALFIRLLINLFQSTIVVRLVKVLFMPFAFLAYIYIFFSQHFSFDFWFNGIWEAGGWHELAQATRLLIFVPPVVYVFFGLLFYIMGWPRENGGKTNDLDKNFFEIINQESEVGNQRKK